MFIIFKEGKDTQDRKTEGQVISIQQSLIHVTEMLGFQTSFTQNFFELSKS